MAKGKIFSAIQDVFSSKADDVKGQKTKKRWGCMGGCLCSKSVGSLPPEEILISNDNKDAPAPPPAPVQVDTDVVSEVEEIKIKNEGKNEQSKYALSVAIATTVVAEAAVPPVHSAVEVAWRTVSARYTAGKSNVEVAAIRIQTAFRGYKARRGLRNLRGLVRLQSFMQSNAVKRQIKNTLHCMQTIARVQSQIRSRRIKMAEENQALQMQLLLKHQKELEKLKKGEEWDDSFKSKEQIEANLQHKQEAAMRREKALAYAFSHQWRNSSKTVNSMFMDLTNLQWGWSWLERWMAARSWENSGTTGRENPSDHASIENATRNSGAEILNVYARRHISSQASQRSSRPPSRQSPSARRIRSASTKGAPLEDDSRSMLSFQSEPRPRRHSLAGSSARDDEILEHSIAVPSYMEATRSAQAKFRIRSPLSEKIASDRASVSSVKKILSRQPSLYQ